MKCKRCGVEIKEGCLYCSSCGKEVQIVPDYNIEEEYLSAILVGSSLGRGQEKADSGQASRPQKKKKVSSVLPILCVGILLAAAIAGGIAYKMYVNYEHANSFEYQVAMAEQEASAQNMDGAIRYYETALALKPGDRTAKLAIADIYMGQKAYDAALVIYKELLQVDGASRELYQKLIEIYEAKEDYENIIQLSSEVTDAALLDLFQEYMVTEPVFSAEEGVYGEYITLTLASAEGDEIYYTLDGTEPDKDTGIFYEENMEIPLDEEGEYTVKAVCRNTRGIYSDVETANYRIDIKPPAYPNITPNGGRITEETYVTITAEADCSIYYTWDGTEPTTASAKYTEPLEIPVGNNILSVLVFNYKTRKDSGVYRANFIYYPA